MDRIYRLHREPPSVADRLLARPLEVLLAVWSVVAGTQLLVTAMSTGVVLSASVSQLPSIVALVMSAAVGLGGGIAAVGLLYPWCRDAKAWYLERGGWTLASAGWVGYAITVGVAYPNGGISWGSPLAVGLGLLVRVVALTLKLSEAQKRQSRIEAERLTGGGKL